MQATNVHAAAISERGAANAGIFHVTPGDADMAAISRLVDPAGLAPARTA